MKYSNSRCIGVVVKNPNDHKALRKNNLGNLFASFAATIPQKKQYRFDELIVLKKSDLIALAKKENAKIWLSWTKAKISNTIIGAQ
tara:strand:+ start:372 stop:629 length:258 start_codon:yes stop_codon:yes gene_type:complete